MAQPTDGKLTVTLEVRNTDQLKRLIDDVAGELAKDAAKWLEDNERRIELSRGHDITRELCANAFLEGGATAFARLIAAAMVMEPEGRSDDGQKSD